MHGLYAWRVGGSGERPGTFEGGGGGTLSPRTYKYLQDGARSGAMASGASSVEEGGAIMMNGVTGRVRIPGWLELVKVICTVVLGQLVTSNGRGSTTKLRAVRIALFLPVPKRLRIICNLYR